MRSLGTRRVALAAGVATVAVIALAGCSAGQVAETAILKPPIAGLNTRSPDGGLLIRNLQVLYNNPTGYPAGSSAPIEVSLYNETQRDITVLISSRPAESETAGLVSAQQVGISGGSGTPSASAPAPSVAPDPSSSASPSASAEPAAPSLQPARITIPPLSYQTFQPGGDETLQAVGLSEELRPGTSLNLVFEVSTSNQPLVVPAPFAIPLSPASRAPGIDPHENLGGDSENDNEEAGN